MSMNQLTKCLPFCVETSTCGGEAGGGPFLPPLNVPEQKGWRQQCPWSAEGLRLKGTLPEDTHQGCKGTETDKRKKRVLQFFGGP